MTEKAKPLNDYDWHVSTFLLALPLAKLVFFDQCSSFVHYYNINVFFKIFIHFIFAIMPLYVFANVFLELEL